MIGTMLAFSVYGESNLPPCGGSYSISWNNCFGAYAHSGGDKYVGVFKGGKLNAQINVMNLSSD